MASKLHEIAHLSSDACFLQNLVGGCLYMVKIYKDAKFEFKFPRELF